MAPSKRLDAPNHADIRAVRIVPESLFIQYWPRDFACAYPTSITRRWLRRIALTVAPLRSALRRMVRLIGTAAGHMLRQRTMRAARRTRQTGNRARRAESGGRAGTAPAGTSSRR